jgi:hypothetical protein
MRAGQGGVTAEEDFRGRREPAHAEAVGAPFDEAVMGRFTSAATCCIHAVAAGPSSRHTAAGLPPKAASVKASTWKKRTNGA